MAAVKDQTPRAMEAMRTRCGASASLADSDETPGWTVAAVLSPFQGSRILLCPIEAMSAFHQARTQRASMAIERLHGHQAGKVVVPVFVTLASDSRNHCRL